MNILTYTPSLKRITLVKIAISLWNQDIRGITEEFDFTLDKEERRHLWQETEDEVVAKVSQLSRPGPLEKEILGFIKPIGFEILKWMEFHNYDYFCYGYVERASNMLFWTPEGRVDKKKTAEVFIQDENSDITLRYKLACIYCFEDYIPELWNKIPENIQKDFYSEKNPSYVQQPRLIVLWTYDIKGKVEEMDEMIQRLWEHVYSPYQDIFEGEAFRGNKVAIEYFFQKLDYEEKELSLHRTPGGVARSADCLEYADNADCADVFCFLLSQMDERQQRKAFKYYSCYMLQCFLEWPWQSLFMEMATRVRNFLSKCGYLVVLGDIVCKVKEGFKDFDYQELFREFWQQIPDDKKTDCIADCNSAGLLSDLFDINDESNIRLFLKDERRNLIFCVSGQHICEHLVYYEKWNLLEFLIQENISSKKEMIKLKEEFEKYTTGWCWYEITIGFKVVKDKWVKFYQLLDDFICGYNKRSVELNSSPSKKRCSIEFEEVL